MVHRTIELLTRPEISFAQNFLLKVLKLIGDQPPINLSNGTKFVPYLRNVFEIIVNAHVDRLPIDQWNVKQIYMFLLEREMAYRRRTPSTAANYLWQLLTNFQTVPALHQQGFLLFYKLIPNNDLFYSKGITSSPFCSKCHLPETLRHLLLECHNSFWIDLAFQRLVKQVTRHQQGDFSLYALCQSPRFAFSPRQRQYFCCGCF